MPVLPEQSWSERAGAWLFHYRSYTPLPLIALCLLFFRPADLGDWNLPLQLFGLLLALLGEAVRVLAVGHAAAGTSGRENYLRADGLNCTGLYSLVRNPLYIGNLLIFAGLLTTFASLWAGAITLALLALQYALVVRAEERYLHGQHRAAYDDYCRRVPRWWPRFHGGLPPAHPFDLKHVVFKENDSLFNLLAMFLLIVAYKGRLLHGRWPAPGLLGGTLATLCAAYAAIKIVKRKKRSE
jgi:protein-S-isoprenylcysteine O-methyltransferase Ste14